ncbi:MAG: hypothetical protein U1F68_17160 [Gammaproteobacteria bacterium]
MLILLVVAVVLIAMGFFAGLSIKPGRGHHDVHSPNGASAPKALIAYGHHAHDMAHLLVDGAALGCAAVTTLDELADLLEKRQAAGIVAISRMAFPGEAGKAISLFREYYPGAGIALYGAWDYNVERAAMRALDCGADGVIMPDLGEQELRGYLQGVMDRGKQGKKRPTTVKQHTELLNTYVPNAKFWDHQQFTESPYF